MPFAIRVNENNKITKLITKVGIVRGNFTSLKSKFLIYGNPNGTNNIIKYKRYNVFKNLSFFESSLI